MKASRKQAPRAETPRAPSPPASAPPAPARPPSWPRVALLAVALGAALGAVAVAIRPSPEADPFRYGQDTCAYCKMILSEPGFAGESLNASGRIAKYDDIGCMVRAADSYAVAPAELDGWVEDHGGSGLVRLAQATLVQTPLGQNPPVTPMGYNVVAFASRAAAETYAGAHRGEIVGLDTLFDGLRVKNIAKSP